MPITKYHRLSQIDPGGELTQKQKRDEKIGLILDATKVYINKQYVSSPTDPDFICHLSTLIENSNFKQYQIDKLEVFIDILKIFFPSIDKTTLQQSIIFL
jgi:hypothetical protein